MCNQIARNEDEMDLRKLNEALEFMQGALANLDLVGGVGNMDSVFSGVLDVDSEPCPVSDDSVLRASTAPTVSSVVLGRVQKAMAAAIGDLMAGGYIQSNEDRLDMEDCMIASMDELAQRMAKICPWAFQQEVCRKFVANTLGGGQ